MIGSMSKVSENSASGAQRRTNPEELGRALELALGPWRPQSFSLHDATGDTLWLSSGTIGPDEHSFVLAALDVFALEPHRHCIHRKLEDGRRALFLAARDPLGGCSGLGFALIEGGVADDSRVISPTIRALLQRFSMLLAPPVERRVTAAAPEHEPEGGTGSELPDNTPIRARGYTRLQPGSGTRRYEVSIAPAGAAHDAAVVERVLDWLAQNRQRYVAKPSSFAVPLSAATVTDKGFAARLEAGLRAHEVDEGQLMLVVPAVVWSAQPDEARPLLELCERLRCHVILDDFQLNDAALELLRHKSIRMLKLQPELTRAAMQERFPRALLAACTQIARVLGIHCIAKRVDSSTASRWLAAAGIDYLDPFNPAETIAATGSGEAPPLRQVS
jgi:hypothetical protein